MQPKKIPVIHQILSVYISFMRGTSMLLQMMVIYYGLPSLFEQIGININDLDKLIFVYLTFVLNLGAFLGEEFRAAILAVPKEQTEAGYSVGLTKLQTFKRIILPQVIPVAIPGLINNLVGVIKGTSFVMAIGVLEVTNASLIPCFKTFSYVEGYLAAAIIYWFFTIILEVILSTIEKKYSKKSIKSEVSYA